MLSIQRLNMDNTWVLKLDNTSILVDPWLMGSEIDYFPWFNEQWHRTKPVEIDNIPAYDFVLITQKYPDHFHKETLKTLNPKQIIVPQSIKKAVSNLLPASTIISFNNNVSNCFNTDIHIHFLPANRKMDPIYDAVIIENGKHSVFLATHGFSLDNQWLKLAKQFVPYDLLITPFNHFKLPKLLGGDVSPGLTSVKNLQELLLPKQIVATHDEDKHAKGLISRLAKITWAPKPETLQTKAFFGNSYLHINHYQAISL